MLESYGGRSPEVDDTAFVASNAMVCGDVRLGPGVRVMFGAQVIAEGGSIEIGDSTVIMENAVVRSTARHSLRIGAHCLVGPRAHVVGCFVEDEVFIATGASVFHAAHLGQGSEVRINGVVHLKTRLAPGDFVPIGWVAVGDPAQILPPGDHEAIWRVQKELDFPLTVYGLERSEASMPAIVSTFAAAERKGAAE